MERVLVLRRGGLGDTLLMVPALRALRRRRPAATLVFAGVREFAAVLAAYGIVDDVLSSEDLELWSLPASPHGAAAARLRAFDRIVADDPAVAALQDERRVQCFEVHPRGTAPLALQLAQRLGLEPVWPDDACLAPARARCGARGVLLAPGSGSRAKCWPRARWLELAGRLAPASELHVVVGPAERERDDPRRWLWPAAVAFVVEPEVTALAGRMRGHSLYVGNDSGPTHLAAMVGIPTVAIFGPTDPRIWAPAGVHVAVVGGGMPLADVAVDAVVAACRRLREDGAVR
jgi:heptosyltransferase-3